jgi:FkbM family methyltransferase
VGDHRNVFKQSAGIVSAIWKHPANSGRRLRTVLRFLNWQLTKRTIRRPRIIAFHGMRLKCYTDSNSTSAAIYFNGLADYWEMKFLLAYLRPGDNFLDVGANAGVYSILAASCVGDRGSIDAFEPMENMARRIEEQASMNCLSNVQVLRLAASDRNGAVEFGFAYSDSMMHIRHRMDAVEAGIQVPSIRLDDFQPEKRYAMGKMDIEGAEPLALDGCKRRLRQANPPVWLLELAGYSGNYGMRSDEVIAHLAAAGYECAIYVPEGRRLVYTDQPWEHGVQNVLAIATMHKRNVEGRLT